MKIFNSPFLRILHDEIDRKTVFSHIIFIQNGLWGLEVCFRCHYKIKE